MSRLPQIALVAWEDRINAGKVFVRVPNEHGRYVRTDMCVVQVECEMCKAAIGEPCHNRKRDKRYWAGTHSVRRQAADRRRRSGLPVPSEERPRLWDKDVLLEEITILGDAFRDLKAAADQLLAKD